jgi:hypothetical protein
MFLYRMPRTWLSVLVAVCAVFAMCIYATAQEGLFDVGDLDRLSSIIVVGTISAGSNGNLSLVVDKVIKAPSAVGEYLTVEWTPSTKPGCDVSAPTAPVHGLWFLQKEKDGNYAFARFLNSQRCHPSQPNYETPAGPLNQDLSYTTTDSVEYKLAVELASAILNSPTPPKAVQLYPGIFEGLDSTKAQNIYQVLANSGNSSAQMIGDLSLIRSGSSAGVDLLASSTQQIMQTPLANAALKEGNTAATYKDLLARAIAGVHVRAAHTVSVLAQLANEKSTDISVRRAASRALRNIHTAQAVVAMAPLINDPDPMISTYAISTLSCFANAVPVLNDAVPGHNINLNVDGPYKTAETLEHFVIGPMGDSASVNKAYWEQWWQTNQMSIKQAATSATSNY